MLKGRRGRGRPVTLCYNSAPSHTGVEAMLPPRPAAHAPAAGAIIDRPGTGHAATPPGPQSERST
jgi:hypothetical protein